MVGLVVCPFEVKGFTVKKDRGGWVRSVVIWRTSACSSLKKAYIPEVKFQAVWSVRLCVTYIIIPFKMFI